MSRPRKIGLAMVAGLIITVAGLLTVPQTREPAFNGKPVSHWLDAVRAMQLSTPPRPPANPDPVAQALEAVAAIGPEALPYVAAWAEGDPHRMKRLYRRLYYGSPAILQRCLPRPAAGVPFSPNLTSRLFSAATAQADAKAIPSLCAACSSRNFGVRRAALVCLVRLAPQDCGAVLPVFQQALGEQDFIIQASAASYLRRAARTDPEARRILIEHLEAAGTNAPEWMRQAARAAPEPGGNRPGHSLAAPDRSP